MPFRTNKTPVLQEKTASGSVASFNTALAMPLVSCNIAVNAWQEGSGDPSPVNDRHIHGYSEVNATRAGKNLFNYESVTWEDGYLDDNQEYHTSTVTHYSSPFPITPNTIITASGFSAAYTSNIYMLDKNRNWLGRLTARYTTEHHFTTPQNCYYLQIQCQRQENGSNLQFEAGSTATAYEPYVTPTIYTIQLGQEVYGGVLDLDSGVLTVTSTMNTLRANVFNADHPVTGGVTGTKPNAWSAWRKKEGGSGYCTVAPHSTRNTLRNEISGVFVGDTTNGVENYIFLKLDGISGLSNVQNYLEEMYSLGTPVVLVYELATPFDIQLTPTQIETLIGNNTIFADTGDVDLTYNDLDIAKRGSFREVFKLP